MQKLVEEVKKHFNNKDSRDFIFHKMILIYTYIVIFIYSIFLVIIFILFVKTKITS